MAVKELVEQFRYTIWPQRSNITGINAITIQPNVDTKMVEMKVEYNDAIRDRDNAIENLNSEELAHLQSNIRRLQLEVAAKVNQ